MKSPIVVAILGAILPVAAAPNPVTQELKETWHEAGQTRRRIHVTAEGTPPDDFCQFMGGVNKQCYIHESYGHVVDTSYELGLGGDQRFWADSEYALENWKTKTNCKPGPDECVNVQRSRSFIKRDDEDRVRPGLCLVNAEVKETWHEIRTRRRIHVTAEGADVTIFCNRMKGENKQCYDHKCYDPPYVVDISHDLGPAGDHTFWEDYKQTMDLWMKETSCKTG
ncbi:hypothetical protein FHETE_7099 [Fusarium heterosporum]|uniref:Uncharacterized protein n=1 Tax=Fusarium heterosporum TaxID=42747 RepID=A0A8H5T902_FUSHE|nr:hypothetical protein FHETE_7099 [Fusarium heterosporum]